VGDRSRSLRRAVPAVRDHRPRREHRADWSDGLGRRPDCGDELVIEHPNDELGTAGALVTLGGPALFLLGVVAFGARVGRHEPWTRVAAAVVLAAAIPLAADARALAVSTVCTALLAVLVAADVLGVGVGTARVE